MRQEDLQQMRTLRLFDGMAESYVESMLRASFLQRFPARVELAREGEPADFLHLIIDGQVEVYASHHRRETTVSILGPGQSFILAAVLLDRVYLKSARALSPSRILMIPAEAVRQYFERDVHFARSLGIELAIAYRDIVKELKNQKLRSSLERLANWLLARNTETGASGRFALPFDKKVLAARLGMAPEVLSRSFAALAAYAVSVDGSSVHLQDIDALRKVAHPSAFIDDPAT
ncbi:MAG: cyclic nucleotide-binding domain-containing protein [Rhizobiales bacterium]|mgnify:FL=1|jgi:CRP/FNR family transcriptional activator FtrB|nr:cyclic nucleotide-binding domain-containing protein [Hyphomicrobiales bacterium]MBP9173476.1 cyclic nucleotide-binding domain-containing protein [Hyphomicrobiales bacterium]